MSKGAAGKERDRAYMEWRAGGRPQVKARESVNDLHGELTLGLQGGDHFLGKKVGKERETPMLAGKFVCRHWRKRFGWLNYRVGDRRAQVPAGCNRWECSDCGPRKRARLESELRTGMKYEGWGREFRTPCESLSAPGLSLSPYRTSLRAGDAPND